MDSQHNSISWKHVHSSCTFCLSFWYFSHGPTPCRRMAAYFAVKSGMDRKAKREAFDKVFARFDHNHNGEETFQEILGFFSMFNFQERCSWKISLTNCARTTLMSTRKRLKSWQPLQTKMVKSQRTASKPTANTRSSFKAWTSESVIKVSWILFWIRNQDWHWIWKWLIIWTNSGNDGGGIGNAA